MSGVFVVTLTTIVNSCICKQAGRETHLWPLVHFACSRHNKHLGRKRHNKLQRNLYLAYWWLFDQLNQTLGVTNRVSLRIIHCTTYTDQSLKISSTPQFSNSIIYLEKKYNFTSKNNKWRMNTNLNSILTTAMKIAEICWGSPAGNSREEHISMS